MADQLRKLDDSEDSDSWENEYFKDKDVASLFERRAVLLRFEANSQEAGFLSAFCPISSVPALVIIHNGQLRENLAAPIASQDFLSRLKIALSIDNSTADPAVVMPPVPYANTETAHASASATVNAPSANSLGSSTSPAVQRILEDRRRRLDIDKKSKDEIEKAEKIAAAKARRAEVEAANTNTDPAKAKQLSYAHEERKRKQEVREDRDRIMREIENDKVLRREKEERRKAVAKAEAKGNDGADGLVDKQLHNEATGSSITQSKFCAIQVRLFDGSTLKARFSPEQTIRKDVRVWIDQNQAANGIPYTLKQILTPKPNRAINVSEEEESLQSLELTPSATLVMVPVRNYVAAYDPQAGLILRGLRIGYHIVSTGAEMIYGALGTFLHVAPATTPDETSADSVPSQRPSVTSTRSASGINVRTLSDQRDSREDQAFYNGNTLNFEPRKNHKENQVESQD